jgi:ribosomal protein S18 acetylase RimI-like enzyme
MTILLRRATEDDAQPVAALLAELGYPSSDADVRHRLARVRESETGCVLVAQAGAEVVGLVTAELVPYFPRGSTICRISSLVVSGPHRGRRIGEQLVSAAAEFAREHWCAGIEITSAEHRLDAHRFYERLGFARTSFRFFRAL